MAAGTKPEASLRRSPGGESHEEALDDLGEKRKKQKTIVNQTNVETTQKGTLGRVLLGDTPYGMPMGFRERQNVITS